MKKDLPNMKVAIVYDSNFGNTKLVAEEIAKTLGDDVHTTSVKKFNKTDLEKTDLLIIGSPINAWRPTAATMAFLDTLESGSLDELKFTTYDTRIKLFHGDAKEKMASKLKKIGAKLIAEPTAFYVTGKEGPLFEGELEKAAEWAKVIKVALQ